MFFSWNLHDFLQPRLLSKHFCLQPFIPKDWIFSLFIKSVNLNLQIIGKYISKTLTSKHPLSIADKHHFPREYYGLVIKYTVSHHPNWCIKVGNTSLRCLVGRSYQFFCNQTWQSQSVSFSLKLYSSFLSRGFNCLKVLATMRRQLSSYLSVPMTSWYSFSQPRKDERLSWPWNERFWTWKPCIGNPAP